MSVIFMLIREGASWWPSLPFVMKEWSPINAMLRRVVLVCDDVVVHVELGTQSLR